MLIEPCLWKINKNEKIERKINGIVPDAILLHPKNKALAT